jgi:hypothetical protein
MSENLTRRQEQKVTSNVIKWGVAVVAVIFLGLHPSSNVLLSKPRR